MRSGGLQGPSGRCTPAALEAAALRSFREGCSDWGQELAVLERKRRAAAAEEEKLSAMIDGEGGLSCSPLEFHRFARE